MGVIQPVFVSLCVRKADPIFSHRDAKELHHCVNLQSPTLNLGLKDALVIGFARQMIDR